MKKRVITGALLLLVLVPIFLVEALFPIFYGIIFLLASIASYEITSLNKERKQPLLAIILTIVLTLTTLLLTNNYMNKGLALDKYLQYYSFILIDFFPLFALVPFLVMITFVVITDYTIEQVGQSMISIVYIGIGFASMLTLRMMGVRFIIYLFLITILTDMFAYIFGMKFGKHKMAKRISPKKSWEGAIGGALVATLIASSFALFYDIFKGGLNPEGHMTLLSSFSKLGELSRGIQALILVPITLCVSILGQIGDLIASKMKRSYGVSDFGNLFPGHGGVMDRFDSSIFASLFLVITFLIIQMGFPV